MSSRYYRPTIVFTPDKEELIADRARALKKDVQDFLRDAVLAALSDSTLLNKSSEAPPPPPPDLLDSLSRIALELASRVADLDRLIAVYKGGIIDQAEAGISAASSAADEGRSALKRPAQGTGSARHAGKARA